MSYSRASENTYIEDAKAHNPWWEGSFEELAAASAKPPRSDLHKLLDQLDESVAGGTEERIFSVHGQSGVGRTTLLKQIAATVVDDESLGVDRPHVDHAVADAYSPRQVLYLPFEESLYQLEESSRALDYADVVLSYFASRVAQASDGLIVLLDDVGALGDEADRRYELLERFVGEDTLVVMTGDFRSQIAPPDSMADVAAEPVRVLPMKFVDYVKIRAERDLADLVERHQSERVDPDVDTSLIQRARRALSNGGDSEPTGPEAFARSLEQFYYEALDDEQRQALHSHCRTYLRTGGFPEAVVAAGVNTESSPEASPAAVDQLLHSQLLLFLYKELSDEHGVDRPKKLHHLCSLAAAGQEHVFELRELTERLNVDRRTVQSYVEALESEIVLTGSRDYSLRRHRDVRLYLRDPRHVTLLSRRHEHEGFDDLAGEYPFNPEFERQIARTAAFDHAMRLAYNTSLSNTIEYTETEEGVIEYILRDGETVYPFALGYEPRPTDVRRALAAFDPATGVHTEDGETLPLDYEAPIRFNICDTPPLSHLDGESLIETVDAGDDTVNIAHIPLWLFVICA